MALELAKVLKLVAPVSMDDAAQIAWLASAVDALEDIRADEVRAISAELRRSVTRHNQIVPEISKLVAHSSARSNQSHSPASPWAAEMEINRRSQELRAIAHGDKRKLSDAFEWERQARVEAGLPVIPYPKPLSANEINEMPAHIREMGLKMGFLTLRNGEVVEAAA
jgi:hypothetical protein